MSPRYFLKFHLDLVLEGRYPWGHWPDFALFFYIVCLAQRANDGGRARFYYGKAINDCTMKLPRGGALTPSRDQVRRALQRLAQHRLIELPTGEVRRAQGRAQRYIEITVVNAAHYGIAEADGAQMHAQDPARGGRNMPTTTWTPREKLEEVDEEAIATPSGSNQRGELHPRPRECQCCGQPPGGSRNTHGWQKALSAMDDLGLNGPTRGRLTTCHLSDLDVYTLLSDAREGGKGGGWVWSAVKRMGEETRR